MRHDNDQPQQDTDCAHTNKVPRVQSQTTEDAPLFDKSKSGSNALGVVA
jgi:hypothetical protein